MGSRREEGRDRKGRDRKGRDRKGRDRKGRDRHEDAGRGGRGREDMGGHETVPPRVNAKKLKPKPKRKPTPKPKATKAVAANSDLPQQQVQEEKPRAENSGEHTAKYHAHETRDDQSHRATRPGLPQAPEPQVLDLGQCSGCLQEHSVSWDDVDGLFVCHNCGQCVDNSTIVSGEEQLVHHTVFDERGQSYGMVHVGANDTGIQVAMHTMQSPRARLMVHRAQDYDANVHIRKFLRQYGNALKLPAPVLAEAEKYSAQIHSKLPPRSMKLELMALSAIYASIRMNKIPLTLLDLARQCPSGNLTVFSIGRSYRQALFKLQLQVPSMDPSVLVPRLFGMFLEEIGRTDLERPIRDAVLLDAGMLLDWVSRTETRAQHPTVLAATSIFFAMEMNKIPLPKLEVTARAFHISETALKTKVGNIRQAMTAIGQQYLPYGDHIKPKNVVKYARTILGLSALKTRAPVGEKLAVDQGGLLQAAQGGVDSRGSRGSLGTDSHGDGGDGHASDEDDLEDVDVTEYLRTMEEVRELEKAISG